MINKFVERLQRIGIEVQLIGNYPWIYLDSVNGNKVSIKLFANHGFTAFITPVNGGKTYCPDLRELFKTIRKYR